MYIYMYVLLAGWFFTMKWKNQILVLHVITKLIIYMKKLLDSDWLRAVQFKCNTSAKSVTPVQITHRNSRSWLTERQKEIF